MKINQTVQSVMLNSSKQTKGNKNIVLKEKPIKKLKLILIMIMTKQEENKIYKIK